MYKANPSHPAKLRFSEAFENLVARWNRDWTKTWNDYTRRFTYTAGADLKNIENNLSKLFAGADAYPNLIKQLLEIRQSFEAQKDWDKAASTAKIAAELYPQSDTTNGYYAISLIIVGKKDEARTFLKKAQEINSRGIASAGAVNQIGLAIAGADKLEAGIEWLKLATEFYPKEAALYGSLGDLYQKQGRREQAIDSYKKALEVDPNLEPAKEKLKKLM